MRGDLWNVAKKRIKEIKNELRCAFFSGFTSNTDRITNFPDDCQWNSHFVYFKKSTDSICLHGCCLLLVYRIVTYRFHTSEKSDEREREHWESMRRESSNNNNKNGTSARESNSIWEALHAQRLYGWAYNVCLCVSVRFAQHITDPIYKRDAIKHKINLLL